MSIETAFAKAMFEDLINGNKENGINGVTFYAGKEGNKYTIQFGGEEKEIHVLPEHWSIAAHKFSAEGYFVTEDLTREDDLILFNIKKLAEKRI